MKLSTRSFSQVQAKLTPTNLFLKKLTKSNSIRVLVRKRSSSLGSQKWLSWKNLSQSASRMSPLPTQRKILFWRTHLCKCKLNKNQRIWSLSSLKKKKSSQTCNISHLPENRRKKISRKSFYLEITTKNGRSFQSQITYQSIMRIVLLDRGLSNLVFSWLEKKLPISDSFWSKKTRAPTSLK